MKNQILSLLACICMCVGVQSAQAQDKEFNTLLTSFVELKGLEGTLAKDILQRTKKKLDDALAYEYLWNKDVYLKPEDCNSYPIAYYKMKGDIVVIIFSNKDTDKEGKYYINIQSYKKGKFINKRRNVINFTQDMSSGFDIYLSEDKKLMIFKGVSNGKSLQFEQKVGKNGEIDKAN